MGRSRDSVNPVDAARKKEKQKELKRNREVRKQHRQQALKRMSAEDIQQEIYKIQRIERTGLADQHMLQKKQKLEQELKEAQSREQQQRIEERKNKASHQQQHAVVQIQGLEKILGKTLQEEDEEEEPPGQVEERKTADTKIEKQQEVAATAAGTSGPSVTAPAADASSSVSESLLNEQEARPWLEEPPGLRKPPYLPASLTSPISYPVSHSVYSPYQSTVSHSTASSSAYAQPHTDKAEIMRISLPQRSNAESGATHISSTRHPSSFRPHSFYVSSQQDEIDPMDPNPESAFEHKYRRMQGGGGGAGRGIMPNTADASPSHITRSAPVTGAPPAKQPIPRPAFVPSVIVRNRTQPQSLPNRVLSLPKSGMVNSAPIVGPALPPPRSAHPAAPKPGNTTAEYEQLMRELG